MVTQKQRAMARRKLDSLLRHGSLAHLRNDIEYMDIKYFNLKYQQRYKSKKSMQGTIRRIENYLDIPLHTFIRHKHHGITTGSIKNVYDLKYGAIGTSIQQVNILIKYDVYKGGKCINKTKTGKKIPRFITFTCGVSEVASLKNLLKCAKKKFNDWLKHTTSVNIKIRGKKTLTYQWKKV